MSMSSETTAGASAEAYAKDSIVEARGIGKLYDGGIQALQRVDLKVPEGKMTTLLGPSGCGKTTLLKIIAGLLDATEGDVLVKGQKIEGPGPERASCSRTSR